MISQNAWRALSLFGLSQKEIEVYVAGLRQGACSAHTLANLANVNRSTTYDILRAFVKRGLTSKVIEDNVTLFSMATPEKLHDILREKIYTMESAIDELNTISDQESDPLQVTTYYGKEGLKTILNAVLNQRKPTDVISTSKIFKVLIYYFPQYITTRHELGTSARVIQEYSAATKALQKKDHQENRQTRMIKDFNCNSATFIAGDCVALLRLTNDNLGAIKILDTTIAADYRKTFAMLWQQAVEN